MGNAPREGADFPPRKFCDLTDVVLHCGDCSWVRQSSATGLIFSGLRERKGPRAHALFEKSEISLPISLEPVGYYFNFLISRNCQPPPQFLEIWQKREKTEKTFSVLAKLQEIFSPQTISLIDYI